MGRAARPPLWLTHKICAVLLDCIKTLFQLSGVLMEREEILIEGARRSGLTIDFLHDLTHNLSRQALRKVIGNASSIPSYKKSSDNPYFFRIAKAPSSDSL